jgi:hypothetical protein
MACRSRFPVSVRHAPQGPGPLLKYQRLMTPTRFHRELNSTKYYELYFFSPLPFAMLTFQHLNAASGFLLRKPRARRLRDECQSCSLRAFLRFRLRAKAALTRRFSPGLR